jgi:ABC-2 type transport system permease protein
MRAPSSTHPAGDSIPPILRQTAARRYLSIYAALWRNSVIREMSFKTNFLLWIVVELLWFALQLAFIGVLYLHTDQIATWTKW